MPARPYDTAATGFSHGFVTTSDSVDETVPYRYLLLTTAGTLKISDVAGNTYVVPSLPAGSYFLGEVGRVWATGGTLNAAANTTVIGYR